MNNQDKQKIIARLSVYWADRHPDCCIELPDGRKVFHQELLEYKHDMLLTSLYAKSSRPPTTWLMWAAIGTLFVVEALRYV